MREDLLEVLIHTLMIGLYGVAALVTGAVGLIIEYHSLLYLLGGDYQMAGWVGVFGLIALIFAYLIFTDKVVPAVLTSFGSSPSTE